MKRRGQLSQVSPQRSRHGGITVASPLHHRCITVASPLHHLATPSRSGSLRTAFLGSLTCRMRKKKQPKRSWTIPNSRIWQGCHPRGCCIIVNLFCRRIHISNKLYGFQNRWMWRINATCYHQKGDDSHGRLFDPLSTHCLLAVPGRCDSHWKIPPVRELSAKGETERLNKKKMACDMMWLVCSCMQLLMTWCATRCHAMTCDDMQSHKRWLVWFSRNLFNIL